MGYGPRHGFIKQQKSVIDFQSIYNAWQLKSLTFKNVCRFIQVNAFLFLLRIRIQSYKLAVGYLDITRLISKRTKKIIEEHSIHIFISVSSFIYFELHLKKRGKTDSKLSKRKHSMFAINSFVCVE